MRRPRLANKQHEVCAFFMSISEPTYPHCGQVPILMIDNASAHSKQTLCPTRIRVKIMKKLMSMLLCITAVTFAACDREQQNGVDKDGNLSLLVATGEATEITNNSVTILSSVIGDVSKYGNIEVGIMYSDDEEEVTSHNGRTRKGAFVDDGDFSTEISNLSSMTQYYYCAYAKVNGNTAYGAVETFSTDGNHSFSVGDGKYVKFSQGNLQYQPSTDTWRFAEHQYDVYGRSAEDNIGSSGWIDLFAWGTGDDPMFVGDYYNYKTYFTDWGNNQIGNDSPYTWRTLTGDEWNYLLSGRLNSQAFWGLAKVNNIQGLIILPDNFESPKGIAFNSGYKDGYQTNVYTASEWEKMVKAGAIFLPANDGEGSYWSSTVDTYDYAYHLFFNEYRHLDTRSSSPRKYGYSVRLVQDL